VFDESPASQWILYVYPPSMSTCSPLQAGHSTLPASHVGLEGAGRYSSAGVVNAIGTTVMVDCKVTVVMGRVPDWLVSCARLPTGKQAEMRQLVTRDRNIFVVTS